MNIIEIIGIDKKIASLLKKEGISQVEDLLSLSSSQLKKLAKKIGISYQQLDTWQEHADLMRISGITPEMANALNLIGIDSVKEFSHRNPKNTLSKLKDFKKENPRIKFSIPSESNIVKWIQKAKELSGTPSTPTRPDEDSEEEDFVLPENKLIEFEPFDDKDYGKYGADYWNSKWERAPIIYTGRALRGEQYNKQIDVDVKSFIKKNDAILKHVINQLGLRKDTPNETALAIQKFVCEFLKYTYDEESSSCPEFWQFPFESIQSGIGDCEDGAILIASMLINAGIPSWRVKVCAGQVLADPIVAPSESELGGHSFPIYLADRPESKRKLEWVILDWCYLQDPDIPIEEKPLARDGGHEGAYKEIWFTFNDEYSWAQNAIEIKEGRVSKNRSTKKEEVVAPLRDILKSIARDELDKVLKKLNLIIE